MDFDEVNTARKREIILNFSFLIFEFFAFAIAIRNNDVFMEIGFIAVIIREYLHLMSCIIPPKDVVRRIKFLRVVNYVSAIVSIPMLLISIFN